ncbi:diaminobutyrate--2-oxoglutarate transaminase [Hyphomonas sp. WL0036]|uniref:diaminobutyrate--2-oxoglutarate transaminase n=1 Tax=Hyphomonas sediminis TaxID=2866160 RepID=UPI001C80AAB7|nr:diaminobutyrate--2-oxoglutarate transaminase [Hyphomonas sediminis]MBY9067492.1 diaminobutyrate--2-oxoglutarate transaminase [Hyphomonas sediminis]
MAYEDTSALPSIFERRESRVRSYCRSFPAVFKSARGAELIAEDGTRYIDFLAGCSTLNYGHNHPELKQALLDYIQADGVAHGLDMHTRAKASFLETFEKRILKPRSMDYRAMFPGPTGANAVEAALKIARKVTGRTNVIAFTNGFHGMTLGALAATGNSGKRGGAGIPLTGVVHEPYDGYFGEDTDTAEQLDRRLSDPSSGLDKPAAIIVEVVQGEGGLNVASDAWLRRVEQIARKHGALFIIDDIQAGIGRTGGFFSFEKAGVKPDIITLAKSLSGLGLPMALTLIRPDHDRWKPGEHNGTFRGNNHAFVTAAKAIDLFWSDDAFERDVARKGERLRAGLAKIGEGSALAGRLKGRGMMSGIEMQSGEVAAEVCAECFENGLIIETSGSHDEVVKVLAPLTISDAQLDAGLEILADAVRTVGARHRKSAA